MLLEELESTSETLSDEARLELYSLLRTQPSLVDCEEIRDYYILLKLWRHDTLTLDECGRLFSFMSESKAMSRERVRQVIEKAFRKIRNRYKLTTDLAIEAKKLGEFTPTHTTSHYAYARPKVVYAASDGVYYHENGKPYTPGYVPRNLHRQTVKTVQSPRKKGEHSWSTTYEARPILITEEEI